MQSLRLIQLLIAFAVVLPVTGCKFLSAFTNHSTQPVVPGQVIKMPSVTITDLDATGRRLSAAGLIVLVKRPELVVNPDRKNGTPPYKLPEINRPFEPSHWNHIIAAQDPPPGTALRSGSVITLTAGIHHGAGLSRPWLDTHAGSVSSRGEKRCRDCHTKTYCSECHMKLQPPDKTQQP